MTNHLENVEVELEPGFPDYYLPPVPDSPEALAEAVGRSWRLLQVAPLRVTAPLLAAAYAAPLSEILVLDSTLWLWGRTGSFKSTVAALFLSHFGYFSEDDLSLNFEWTPNALEKMLFLAKDVLALVDDWRPGVTRAESDEMDRKAQRLARTVGNRQGRGRMFSDTRLRGAYAPRGVVAVTAEALPEGPTFQSVAARIFSTNLSGDEVDLAKVSEMKKNRRMLSVAMAGYVRHVAAHYDRLADELPARHERLRDILREKLPGSHPRTPDTAAVLIAALQQLRDYTVGVGAMGEEEAQAAYERARDGVVEAARAHVAATSGGDPSTRFVEIMLSLFDSGRAHLEDREAKKPPHGCERLGWSDISPGGGEGPPYYAPEGGHIGWADEGHLYLHPQLAYAAVSEFAQRGNIPFGIKPGALWDAMARSGSSLADQGRSTTTARVRGETKRVIKMPRSAVFAPEGEEERDPS
jgi:hypothetical protein